MRVYSFFVVAALAATLTFAGSSEGREPEPSEPQMKASFGKFFSQLEARLGVQFTAFKKAACQPITRAAGYVCSFSYSTRLFPEQLSILLPQGTLSGTFFLDEAGQLKFETVIG